MSIALQHLRTSYRTLQEAQDTFMREHASQLVRTTREIAKRLEKGNKILVAGNGGSASQASHFAAELTGRFIRDRDPLPAIALTTDTSAITAIGNDFGFENIFDRQLYALAQPGDVFIAISTSGNSPNILQAAKTALWKKCYVVALTGADGDLTHLCDECLYVEGPTPTVQEIHLFILHSIVQLVDEVYLR